jgi:WD40 repeat protein
MPSPEEHQDRLRQQAADLPRQAHGKSEPATLVPPAAPSKQPAAERVEVPGYEVLGLLGEGGMGVVYKARQRSLDRVVALKMILHAEHAGEGVRERFGFEAQALARLQHPHIVQIHEVGEHSGLPYFALEFCGGGSLAEQLDGTPWEPAKAAALVETLARAVHAAHRAQVIHRDLKPANVLLSADGTPKITDFGLAKKLDEAGRTASGALVGTPSYMAPEQAGGKSREMGPACDVYALGAILYELLTGRPPFKAATTLDTALQVLSEEPVAVRRLQPTVPRDLETICHQCLQKDPKKRYGSAEALAEDLRRFGAGEPVAARPVGAVGRTLRWARRRPAVAALTVLSLLVTLVGFTMVLWQWRRASVEWYRAEDARQEAAERAEAETQARLEKEQALQDKEQALHSADQRRLEAENALGEARRSDYFTHVAFAEREWERNNLVRAEELLDTTPLDLRHWEWHYLKRRCHAELLTCRGHQAGVTCVAFSPDGHRIASSSYDGTVRLWDAATGKQQSILKGHSGAISGVVFSPDGKRLASLRAIAADSLILSGGKVKGELKVWDSATGKQVLDLPGCLGLTFSHDGKRIASCGSDGTPHIWDAATGREALVLKGKTGFVIELAYSRDGRYLATASMDVGAIAGDLAKIAQWGSGNLKVPSEIKLWDAATGEAVSSFRASTAQLSGLAVSPDSKQLATSHLNGRVRLWDATTGREVQTLRGHAGMAGGVAFSPDGRRLAVTGLTENTVRVWDASSGEEVLTLRGAGGFRVSFSPDSRRLAAAGAANTVKVWDAVEGQGPRQLRGHKLVVMGVAFSPDGRRLASVANDKTLRVWDARTGAEVFCQDCPALRVAFSPDGTRLATAGGEPYDADQPGRITIWDAATGKALLTLPGHASLTLSIGFSPDGARLFSCSCHPLKLNRPGEVKVWDLKAAKEVLTIPQPNHVNCAALSPDGRFVATANVDNTAKIWDAATGKLVRSLSGHPAAVRSVTFSPDGRRIASGGVDGSLRIWDSATGNVRLTLPGHQGVVVDLAYSADGRRLATATFELAFGKGEVKVWDLDTGNELLSLAGTICVAFSPDGSRLAAGSLDLFEASLVKIWDATPLAEVAALAGHAGSVRSLAASGDGRYVATASDDATVRVWDVVKGGPSRLTLRGHAGQVWAVAFSPDGKRLVSGGVDKTVRVWDVAEGKEVHCLQGHAEEVRCVAFSPDGKHLAAGDHAGIVRIWDALTGQEERQWRAQEGFVMSLCFSPDGDRLATGSETVKLWRVATGEELLQVKEGPRGVYALVFSPDGLHLASAGEDRTIHVWDADNGQELRSCRGYADRIFGLAISPDGQHLASVGEEGTVKVWEVATGREVDSFHDEHGWLAGVAFCRDGRQVIAAGSDGVLRIWDRRPLAERQANVSVPPVRDRE